jgi:hypothetical protein
VDAELRDTRSGEVQDGMANRHTATYEAKEGAIKEELSPELPSEEWLMAGNLRASSNSSSFREKKLQMRMATTIR